MLAKLPEARSDRWELVRQIAAVYRSPSRDFKVKLESLDDHLTKLAVSLPVALREWYEVTAELTDLWSGQDYLLAPLKLRVRGGGLEIAAENQY